MANITFYTHENKDDEALSKALQELFNSEKINPVMSAVVSKLLPANQPAAPGYAIGTAALTGFRTEPDYLDDPYNTCDMVFNVLKRSKEYAAEKSPNAVLSDADIKGLEMVVKNVLATCDQQKNSSDLQQQIYQSAKSQNIEFGRKI